MVLLVLVPTRVVLLVVLMALVPLQVVLLAWVLEGCFRQAHCCWVLLLVATPELQLLPLGLLVAAPQLMVVLRCATMSLRTAHHRAAECRCFWVVCKT